MELDNSISGQTNTEFYQGLLKVKAGAERSRMLSERKRVRRLWSYLAAGGVAPWGEPSARYPRGHPHNSREDPRFPSYIRGTFEQEIWKRYSFPEQEEERKAERARKERASSKKVRFDEGTMPNNQEFAGMWRHSFHLTKWSGATLRDWVHVDEAERAATRSSHQAVRQFLLAHAPCTRSGFVQKEVAT